MVHQTRIYEYVSRGPNTAGSMWRVAASQPGWVTRWAMIAFLLVIGIPIFLLIMCAILAAIVVFTVLAGFNWLRWRFGRAMSNRGLQRRNVRVIRRQ